MTRPRQHNNDALPVLAFRVCVYMRVSAFLLSVTRRSIPNNKRAVVPILRRVVAGYTRLSFSTTTFDNYSMPEPPFTHGSTTLPPLDLTELGAQVAYLDEQRRAAADLNQRLQVTYNKAKEAIDTNLDTQPELMAAMESLLRESPLMQAANPRTPRLSSLSFRVEDYARLAAFRHFLATADLWPLPDPEAAGGVSMTDEEYLAGACMGLSQDLARYALGRATVRDVASVQAAQDLAARILDFLVQLDFRNGPLRRKYDGVKYALQAMERLLYELAVTSASDNSASPVAKRARTSPQEPVPELLALKGRLDYRDEMREKLIKKCRDGQKAAKQAVFALHRGDRKRAETLLEQCEGCIRELTPTIEQEPPLRSGSFANVLEEYVEAKLFATWLESPSSSGTSEGSTSGQILVPADFTVIALQSDEYLGGLCDLTGEIGRYAVQRGTQRDIACVRLCLHSNQRILSAIQAMPVFPSEIGKKIGPLRRSIEKLERILYELSLSEAAGGRPVTSEIETGEPHDND